MSRLTPTKEVIRRLFALSGNRCAFPGCSHRLVDENGVFVAEICHIEAALPGGERYNPHQSDEERRAFENLLLLCHAHHKVTDDVAIHTVAGLKKIKTDHEGKYLQSSFDISEALADKILAEFETKFEKLIENSNTILEELRENTATTNQTNAVLEEMLDMLKLSRVIPINDSAIHARQLEFIKGLRKDGQPLTALNALLKFKDENWCSFDGELKYKVLANLGTLYFETGQKDIGAKQLVNLAEVPFESADSLAYLSLGYAISGNRAEFETAFKKAVDLGSENSNLWIAYILAQPDNIPASQIESAIPESQLAKPEILFSLGEAYVDRGNDEKGFALLDTALDRSAAGIEHDWHLRNAIESKRLVRVAPPEKVAFNSFSNKELQSVRATRVLLTRIWDYVTTTELVNSAWSVILNRGITNKILGENSAAEQDLEEAWRLSKHFLAFKNLFHHYIDVGRIEKAATILEAGRTAISTQEEVVEFAACELQLLHSQGQPEVAIEKLCPKIEELCGENRLHFIDLIILTYLQRDLPAKALPFAQRLVDEFPERPEGFIAMGICLSAQQKPELATAHFISAIEKTDGEAQSAHIWYQLGDALSRLNEHETAIVCFEKIPITLRGPVVRHRLLSEYYNAEEYEEAATLCAEMLAECPYEAHASEVLFRVYQNTGRTIEAELQLRDYLNHGSAGDIDHFRLLGIHFYTGLGEKATAAQLALSLTNLEERSLQQRMTIAKLLLETDHLAEGLDIAYNARLDHYEVADAHEAYLACCVGNKEQPEDEMFPRKVRMDCAVVLLGPSGNSRTVFLTDDRRYQSPSILRSTNKLAASLLDKGVGDRISMTNSVGPDSELTVSAIVNKHVYAFQESGSLLETRFAGESETQFLKVDDDGNFSQLNKFISDQLLKSQESRKQILAFYEKDPCTVGMLAKAFKKNFFNIWLDLTNATDTYLRSESIVESDALPRALASAITVVVDPLALLTNMILLPECKLLDIFRGRLVVPQSAIKDLLEYRDELNLPGPRMSIVMQDGELRKHEQSRETLDNTVAVIERILKWCNENALIKTPGQKWGKRKSSTHKNVGSMIGEAFHDTLLLAKESDGYILCDDVRLRAFAVGEFNIDGFSTYQLLAKRCNEEKVPIDDCRKASRKLISANYGPLPISAEDLLLLFEESEYRLKPPFTRAVRSISILATEYCALTLAVFAKLLHQKIAVPSLCEQTMLYVLQEAKRNPNFLAAKPLLLNMIDIEFRVLPQQKVALMEMINTLPSHP